LYLSPLLERHWRLAYPGGTAGTGGTDRVDNFVVSATAVPEPSTVAFAAIGGLARLAALRLRD
jgi:hypothetical protein